MSRWNQPPLKPFKPRGNFTALELFIATLLTLVGVGLGLAARLLYILFVAAVVFVFLASLAYVVAKLWGYSL